MKRKQRLTKEQVLLRFLNFISKLDDIKLIYFNHALIRLILLIFKFLRHFLFLPQYKFQNFLFNKHHQCAHPHSQTSPKPGYSLQQLKQNS